jgi:hypothetical protein
MRRHLALLVILLIAALISPACQPAPEETTVHVDGLELTLTEPKVEFPDSISFQIEVEGEDDISKIALNYQVDKSSPIPVTSVAFPQFETAPKVEASWKWDMTKTGALPPGTGVRYWWSIEDATGSIVETDPASLTFDDERHSWKSLTSDGIDLFWYRGSNSFAQEILSAADEALDRLSQDTGAQLETKVRIYVYADWDELRQAMVYPQEWTGGVAFAEYGTIAIGISTDNLAWGKRATAHELAHLAIHQATLSGYGRQLPTWLDEGLAMYAEGELSSEMQSRLENAIEQGTLFSVKSLCSSFPAQTEQAYLAYAQSYSLVEFLLQAVHGGRERMLDLLDAFRQGSGYVEALDLVYGVDIDELDILWRQYLTSNPEYASCAA